MIQFCLLGVYFSFLSILVGYLSVRFGLVTQTFSYIIMYSLSDPIYSIILFLICILRNIFRCLLREFPEWMRNFWNKKGKTWESYKPLKTCKKNYNNSDFAALALLTAVKHGTPFGRNIPLRACQLILFHGTTFKIALC